jgi:hypothetical protein
LISIRLCFCSGSSSPRMFSGITDWMLDSSSHESRSSPIGVRRTLMVDLQCWSDWSHLPSNCMDALCDLTGVRASNSTTRPCL